MKKLYKFYVDAGRMGSISGIFVAKEEDVNKKLLGCNVYFGEILGKHSDVSVDIEPDMLTVLTDDQIFINKFEALDCSSGYNPFDYLE